MRHRNRRQWFQVPLAVALVLLGVARPSRAQAPMLAACDAQRGKDPNDPGAVVCYLRAASSARGMYENVVRHLRERLGAQPHDTHTRYGLGHLLAGRMLAEAPALLGEAADEYGRAGNSVGEVLARSSLVSYLTRSGRLRDAAAAVTAARTAAESSKQPRLVAYVNTVDAWLAYRELDYGRGLRMLDTVADTVQQSSDSFLRGSWMSARAAILWALGRIDEARAQYRQEADYHASIGNRFDQATALSNVLLTIRGPEHKALALETARIARDTGNHTAESAAYFQLTITAGPEEALAYARRSLEAAIAGGRPDAISRARGVIAQFTLPFDREEAFVTIDRAIAEARGIGDPNQLVRHHFLKSIMRWDVGPREQAIADSLAVFDAVEALRSLPREEDVRAERFAQWRFAYYRLSGHLLAGHHAPSGVASEGDTDLAFRTVERMRARTLLDRLDVAGASTPEGGPELPSLSAIQSALRDNEALITYQLANLSAQDRPFGAWVWTLTREGARAVPVAPPQGLAGAVDMFLGLIQRRDGLDGPAGARLYADYLAPALQGLPAGVTRLLIVPDDALHRVPFSALRETADGEPLGTKFEISILPSASIWYRWRQNGVDLTGAPAFVLADPALPESAQAPALDRSGHTLAPLPAARTEAAALARALRGSTVVLSGGDATERRLKTADLREYRLLHFAAHAVIDDARPDRTAVVLARDASDDGRLHVREIVELPLSGQLVLLSACRSASGTLVPGEGAFGLAHAFFRAGARAVVATLWAVRDRDAAEAFSLVGEALGRGESVASAVSSARRTMKARGEPAAAWAGLVVMGDGDLIPFPGGRTAGPAWWHVVFTALLSATALAWILVRRQQRSRQKAAPQVT